MEYDIFTLGDVDLQFGGRLPNARIAYKTYGTLNQKKDNVIVYPTAFADTHKNNEWLIGEGMALDPQKYFIIVPNLLGNGLSSSPSNTPAPLDKANFPHVTIFDNVRFQQQLLTQQFGIEKIALVTGWSFAAIQSFQWAASYPEMVERIAPFCGAAKMWPHTYVMFEGVKAALLADSTWHNGWYTHPPLTGLRALGRGYAAWGFSQAFYREQGYQGLGYNGLDAFLDGFWDNAFLKNDANDLLAMLWTGQHADISANHLYHGNFEQALKGIQARAFVLPARTDLYFPLQDNEYEVRQMLRAILLPIESSWGHFAGRGINPVDCRFINDSLKALLAA